MQRNHFLYAVMVSVSAIGFSHLAEAGQASNDKKNSTQNQLYEPGNAASQTDSKKTGKGDAFKEFNSKAPTGQAPDVEEKNKPQKNKRHEGAGTGTGSGTGTSGASGASWSGG